MNTRRSAVLLLIGVFVGVLLPVQSFALERLRPQELLDRVRQARESTPPLAKHLRYTIVTDYEDRPGEREYMEFVVDVYFDATKAARRVSSRYWRGQVESTPAREQFGQEIWDDQRFYSLGWWSPGPGVKVWGGGTAIDSTHAARLGAIHSGQELAGILYADIDPYYDILNGAKKIKVRVDMKTFEDIPTYRIEATTERGVYQLWIDPAQDYHLRQAVLRKGAGDLGWGDVPMSELEWMPKESVTYTLTNTEFDTFDGMIFPTQGHVEINVVYLKGGPGGSPSSKITHDIRIDSIELNPDFAALRAFVPDAPPNTLLTDWDNDNKQLVWTGSEISDDEALILDARMELQAILRANIEPRPKIYDEEADGRNLIAAALERAKAEGKRPLLTWGANWCGWCHELEGLCRTNPEINALIDEHFIPVLIDLGHRDKNMDLALEYGLDFNELGTAHVTILDLNGDVVAQRTPASLIGLGKRSALEFHPKKLLDFLTAHALEK